MSKKCSAVNIGDMVRCNAGNFSIDLKIFCGRSSNVFVGTGENKKEVALKVYHNKYKDTIYEEHRKLIGLSENSIHVVCPLGWALMKGTSVLVLEMLSGSLSDIMKFNNGKLLSAWLVRTAMRDLLQGLRFIHTKGIIHADIKPDNIMWCPTNDSFKIIDFGISYREKENVVHQFQSRAYMSPETKMWNSYIQRLSTYNHTCEKNLEGHCQQPNCTYTDVPNVPSYAIDVWSAGIIMTKLLTKDVTFKDCWDDCSLQNKTDELFLKLLNIEKMHKEAKKNKQVYPNDYFRHAYEFVACCLCLDPSVRESSAELVNHIFFSNMDGSDISNRPSWHDMSCMPTRVIRVWEPWQGAISEGRQREIQQAVKTIASKHGRVDEVKVTRGSKSSVMPEVGSVVTGRVVGVTPQHAAVSILAVGNHVLHTPFQGTINKLNVRQHQVDLVEIYNCFRPDDIVLAKVLSLGGSKRYDLSTALNEFGVVTAKCEEGHPLVPASWTSMKCICRTENRKVAKVVPPKNFCSS